MLKKIKTFLENGGYLNNSNPGISAAHNPEETRIAAAALLLEAAHLDGEHSPSEEATIQRLLKERFQLAEEETASLIEAASASHADAVELHSFTHSIKENFSAEERVHLIEMLWEVVYADGVLDDFEANLLRRVGGLLHVSDRERGDAKRRAMKKLGIE